MAEFMDRNIVYRFTLPAACEMASTAQQGFAVG
jgi:hypothetical protein